jgi:hypothetical protein
MGCAKCCGALPPNPVPLSVITLVNKNKKGSQGPPVAPRWPMRFFSIILDVVKGY